MLFEYFGIAQIFEWRRGARVVHDELIVTDVEVGRAPKRIGYAHELADDWQTTQAQIDFLGQIAYVEWKFSGEMRTTVLVVETTRHMFA